MDVMLLLVISTFVLRLINAGSGSFDEEYRNGATAEKRIQSNKHLASSESALCHICGLCFKNLGVHMTAHNQQKPFNCSLCDKQFASASTLRMHQRIHSGEKLSNCPECGKQFIRASMLRRHQKTHRNEKPFYCAECGKQFAYAQGLSVHQRTHTGEKPFICTDCGKQFARAGNLESHQRTHTGVKPFRCAACGKHFARFDHLRKHQCTNSNVKSFGCPECHQQFTDVGDLQIHQRMHVGVRFFGCSLCGKQFTRATNMRRHLLKHTGEKSFKCLKCRKLFARADCLREHQRRKHANLVNSTDSPSLGYAWNPTVVESPLFDTAFESSMDGSLLIHLKNPTIFNCPSLVQMAVENLDDSPSLVQIEDFAIMENPSIFHPILEASANAISPVEKEVSTAMKDPFLLQSVLENPVDSSYLTNPTELESQFVFHVENPVHVEDLSLPEESMDSSFVVHMQNPITFGNPFFFQDPIDNPSLVQKEVDTMLEKLIDDLSLIQADSVQAPEAPVDGPPFFQMQEHIPTNAEDSVPDVQLPFGDSAIDSLEYPTCFAILGERTTLDDQMLNHGRSFSPDGWLSYLESGDNDADAN